MDKTCSISNNKIIFFRQESMWRKLNEQKGRTQQTVHGGHHHCTSCGSMTENGNVWFKTPKTDRNDSKNIQHSGQLQKQKKCCVQEHGPNHRKPARCIRFYIQDIGQSHQPPLFSTMDRYRIYCAQDHGQNPRFCIQHHGQCPQFYLFTMDKDTEGASKIRTGGFLFNHGQRQWAAPLDAFSTMARDRLGCALDHGQRQWPSHG